MARRDVLIVMTNSKFPWCMYTYRRYLSISLSTDAQFSYFKQPSAMAAINSLLSSSCSAQNLLSRPPHSSLLSRRALLRSPFMSVDNSAPSSALGLDGTPLLLSPEMQSPSAPSTGGRQSSSHASEKNTGRPNLSLSSLANAPTWAKLVLGSVVLLAIPVLGKLLRTEGVMKKVEEVEKVVEAAAEAVEKITQEIAEVLPDGESKEEVLKLGKIAFLVDKSAEALEYFNDKIDDAVEATETELKPNEGVQPRKNDVEENTRMAADQTEEKNVKGLDL